MNNENVVVCPHCGDTHKITELNLYDLAEKDNIIDVVGICKSCSCTMLIELEATDGCDVFEYGSLLYNSENIMQADVYYISDEINPNQYSSQINFN